MSNAMVWLTGAALVLCLFVIFSMLGIIAFNGLPSLWPRSVGLYELKDGRKLLAVEKKVEEIPLALAREQHLESLPRRRLVMVANRDFYPQDFVWINDLELLRISVPKDAWVMERMEYGKFIGYLRLLKMKDHTWEGAAISAQLASALEEAGKLASDIQKIEKIEIGKINAAIEKNRLAVVRARRASPGSAMDSRLADLRSEEIALQKKYAALLAQVQALRAKGSEMSLSVEEVGGAAKVLPLLNVLEAWQPNQMTLIEKAEHYLLHIFGFLVDDPREANTEGGVFPAIFGTTMMVLLMTLAVVPFGVLTAFYLSEYAHQGPLVRLVRIALNNLAGVPSIVYGVFGLGFFVYFLGGNIDRFFFADALPAPTWGTGGILWASLTLALLTLPVVVMATEESIAAVPRGMREGSLALGASKFQTLRHILLPASLPGILTGVILAMARGAGEVAPLMITGVVKLAPSLPIDGTWPFIHLERKFMHLGFHIFDVGFQSPNIEASRPMVFATALLLVLLVIALNLAAIILRDRVRRRFVTGAFN